MFELPFPTKHADILGLWSQAKYRPEQHAEHVKMGQEIAAYCHSHDVHDLDGFLAAAENDPSVLRLYQFASGRWASSGRKAMIQRMITGKEGPDA